MQKIGRSKFLVLSGGAAAAAAVPLHVLAATETNLTLQTPAGTIYGTLALPAAAKGVPIVLLIAGSGPADRDGNSVMLPGKNDTLKLLASALASRGIASLRYDKRGIGASAAALTSEKDIRFDTYAEDAAGWVALARDSRFTKISIAGHSEGSLLGMIAAQRGSVVSYVSLEGAGRPAYVVLRDQMRPALTPALLTQADAIFTQLRAGNTYTGAVAPELQSLFRPSVQPYLISWFKYDPAVEIGKLRMPVTIVQGTADVQVTMVDAQALKSGAPTAQLVVVPGMNHVLKIAPDTSSQTAILAGYSDPKLPVAPQVIAAVASAAKAH